MIRRLCLAALGAAGIIALGAGAVFADPSGSKNSFSFPATCDGQTVNFVINNANGQGAGAQDNDTAPFAPAHVDGTNQLFHPTVFDLTFTFTPPSGPSQSFTDTDAMKNPKTPVTCTINYTAPPDADGNVFSLSGTVQGFFSGH
ncbi:MAG TPA: hypothetical protein VH951_03720 [Dehalococcoidia bacterium]